MKFDAESNGNVKFSEGYAVTLPAGWGLPASPPPAKIKNSGACPLMHFGKSTTRLSNHLMVM